MPTASACRPRKRLGVDPARLLKTLMAKAGSDVVCVLAPSDKDVSSEEARRRGRGEGCRHAQPAEAERITGYRVGGISPFGQKKRVPRFHRDGGA